MDLRTVPPEVTGRGTETKGDGEVEDKASTEHLHFPKRQFPISNALLAAA